VKTLYEALQRTLGKIPDNSVFGTRRGAKYEWMSFKDVSETALQLASGCMSLDLVPEVQADG
jgi:hypothetical protein